MSEPSPHVLMTADAVGGVWRYALDLAAGLCAAGGRVTLAVLGPAPDAAQQDEADAVAGLDLVLTGLPLDWLARDAASVVEAGGTLAALAATRRADLVHLNSPALAACNAFRVPVLGVCHSCVATWWQAVRGTAPMPHDFVWRRALVAAGYRAADRLVAPSAAFSLATARAYGLTTAPRVVHNGRAAMPPATAARGLPKDFVFTAGRLWDEGKNAATLDAAATELRLPVLVAGLVTGPHGAHFAPRQARWVGALTPEAVAAYLAARPIFASVAHYEPFGLAVLEAAQAGCALVLSDIATFRELWGDAARFVPPGDAGALARAIQDLAAEPEARARLGAAAQARAGRFSVARMVAGTQALHRALLRSAATLEAAR
ncbi:MAG TPA: glycosyltransferase family 4 protein [Acetobacteraceae bacterium]|nr:glycosyltransferase family 4 protein [Acetobacteraceae bacterium]